MKEADNIYRLDERAGIDLRLIRSMMQHAALVTPMPGWGIFVIGVIGATAAYLTRNLEGFSWVAGWGLTGVIAVVLAVLISSWHIQKTGKSIYVNGYARFWLSLLPAFITAAVLTWVFIEIDQFMYLPATWLLLYGVGVIAASVYSITPLRWMGAAFVVLGIFSVIIPAGNIGMGLGFGGIHLLFGILIARENLDETSH